MSVPSYGTSGSDYGATPVDLDEVRWLVPGITHTITHTELNSLEEQNIEVAYRRLGNHVVEEELQLDAVLDDIFLREMHRQMFCDVWLWAGRYRTRELSIGIDPAAVAVETRNLLGDAKSWLLYETFSIQEVAVRVSHGLTRIHPFPNGNGRLSRLYGDLLEIMTDEDFGLDWGSALGLSTDEDKELYVRALRPADRGDVQPLIRYATSTA